LDLLTSSITIYLNHNQSSAKPFFLDCRGLATFSFDLKSKSKLRYEGRSVGQSASLSVCLGVKHPSGVYDQIFVTVRQLRVCLCGALSLTRERVCRLQLLLVLASAVILGSESRGTRDHILLSQIRDSLYLEGQVPVIPQDQGSPVIPPGTRFLFRRLLRLAGLQWKYSNSPPRGVC
jgi:hypothetical protein